MYEKSMFQILSYQLQTETDKEAQLGITGNFMGMNFIYEQSVWDKFWPVPFFIYLYWIIKAIEDRFNEIVVRTRQL